MKDLERKLWDRVYKYVRFLKMVPFLRMVAVCNNLSFGSADEESDIDLFIIAKRKRLYIVRTFITAIFQILGVRRHGNQIKGRFCLSFFIDDANMDFSKIAIPDDIYLSFWVKSLVPVIDDGVSSDFLAKNYWIKKNFHDDQKIILKESDKKYSINIFGRLIERIFEGSLGDLVEKSLMKWQKMRAERKYSQLSDPSGLIISDGILKFHNIDRRRKYRNAWFRMYGKGEKLTDEKFLRI